MVGGQGGQKSEVEVESEVRGFRAEDAEDAKDVRSSTEQGRKQAEVGNGTIEAIRMPEVGSLRSAHAIRHARKEVLLG